MAGRAMNGRTTSFAFLLLLSGCSGEPAPPTAPPLAGAKIGGPFTLINEDGVRVDEQAFAGKWRIVYFGYTFCPDVCPVDAAAIGVGLKAFEAQAPERGRQIVPIFITVDPQRDTPAVLKAFTANFHPRMVGLTGSADEIGAAAKSYAIYYKAQPPSSGGGYMVDHSRTTYLMDPKGAPVALLPADQGRDAVAAQLAKWVR
jgi:protein SCO1/2